MISLILASKIWDDDSLENVHFPKVGLFLFREFVTRKITDILILVVTRYVMFSFALVKKYKFTITNKNFLFYSIVIVATETVRSSLVMDVFTVANPFLVSRYAL